MKSYIWAKLKQDEVKQNLLYVNLNQQEQKVLPFQTKT